MESIDTDEGGPRHAPPGSSEILKLAVELVRIIRKLPDGIRAERPCTCFQVRCFAGVFTGNLALALHRRHRQLVVGMNA